MVKKPKNHQKRNAKTEKMSFFIIVIIIIIIIIIAPAARNISLFLKYVKKIQKKTAKWGFNLYM